MEYRKETLEELLQVLRRMRRDAPRRKPLGQCHPGAFFTLVKIHEYLEEHPEMAGISVGELSERLEVSLPAVSKMIRNLECKELVERKTDSENRRVVLVLLTEKGRQIFQEAEQQERADMMRIAQRLGEEDMEHLIRIVNKLSHWDAE